MMRSARFSPSQARHGALTAMAAATLLVLSAIAIGARAEPNAAPIDYRNDKYGFTIRIPADVATPDPLAVLENGGMWTSPDGKARLLAVAAPNEAGTSLKAYRLFVMQNTYNGATFDYAPMRSNWFVLSGTQDGKTFYERITFQCGGRFIYGWQMVYPTTDKRRYDRVVEAVHRGYRAGRGIEGRC